MSAIQTVSRPLICVICSSTIVQIKCREDPRHMSKNASIRYDRIINAFKHIFKIDLNLIKFQLEANLPEEEIEVAATVQQEVSHITSNMNKVGNHQHQQAFYVKRLQDY